MFSNPFALISFLADSAIFEASTAKTFLAPAYAAKRLRIPEPQPASKTTLSL